MNSQSSLTQDPWWHLIYTRPNYERKICSALSEKGIEYFLPARKEMRQWSDRKKMIEVPLFPNYLFLKLPSKERHRVFDVKGVVKFICNDGGPATIDEEIIDSIRIMLFGNPEATNEDYVEGEIVEIKSGPLSGLVGVLTEKKGKYKIAIRLKIMQQTILAEISSQDIERAKKNLTYTD